MFRYEYIYVEVDTGEILNIDKRIIKRDYDEQGRETFKKWGIMTAQKQAELFYLRNMAALSASKNFNATEYMLRLINPERYGEKTKVKNNGQIKVSLSINGLTKNGD